MRVDLPAPFSPTMPMTCPRPTRRSTPLSACTPGNLLSIPSITSAVSVTSLLGWRLRASAEPLELMPEARCLLDLVAPDAVLLHCLAVYVLLVDADDVDVLVAARRLVAAGGVYGPDGAHRVVVVGAEDGVDLGVGLQDVGG